MGIMLFHLTLLSSAMAAEGAPSGMLSIYNDAGGSVTVTINGRSTLSLNDNGSAQLSVPAGNTFIKATYRQFGKDYLLESSQQSVRPGALTSVILEPETTARVSVSNKFSVPGLLMAEGRVLAELLPGETEIVDFHPGRVEFSLKAGNDVISKTQLDMVPMRDLRWTAEPPPSGTLLVVNPFPIPIELICDRGMVRTIPAYGKTVYDKLPVGSFHLTARRVSDEFIDDAASPIRPGAQTVWQVDPPKTGLVDLDNVHWTPTRLYIDGTQSGGMSPNQDRHLVLPVGWHELVIRDDKNRVIFQRWVEVEMFDTNLLSVGQTYHVPAVGYGDPRYGQTSYGGGHQDHEDHEHHEHEDDDDQEVASSSCGYHK